MFDTVIIRDEAKSVKGEFSPNEWFKECPMLEHVIELTLEYLIPICELMGIIIVAVSTFSAFCKYAKGLITRQPADIKFQLASGMALSLEFKMAAEILKTVLIREMTELLVLGAVIILRALLSVLIHFEMKENHTKETASER